MPSLCWLMAQSVIQTETDTDRNTSALTLYSRCPWMPSLSWLMAQWQTDRNRHRYTSAVTLYSHCLIARFVLVDGTVTNRNRHRHIHISSHLIQSLSLNVKLVNMVSGCRVTDKQTQDGQKHLSSHLIQSLSLNAKLVLVDGDHTLVEQQVPRLWFNVAQVIGHVERSGHHGPNCHLHPLLVIAQAIVSHNDLCTPSQWSVYVITMICGDHHNDLCPPSQWSVYAITMICPPSQWSVHHHNDLFPPSQWSVHYHWSVYTITLICVQHHTDLCTPSQWSVYTITLIILKWKHLLCYVGMLLHIKN